MLRTRLLLCALLCALTGARAQNHADTMITRMIQGHWTQGFFKNGEVVAYEPQFSGMYSLKVDEHSFTSITYDPCSGMTTETPRGWKYHEDEHTFEIFSEDSPSFYYELLQLTETTLYLRRIYLPEGSEPDVYGLAYWRDKKQ